MMRRLRFALAAFGMLAFGLSAHSQTPARPPSAACRAHAPEAAVRSELAIDVILRVMCAESGGSASIVSTKGAIGCMQIMPATWAYLAPRYGLGTDPYDARMNMIGGAMYLAELTRRFGLPGAYAAYNAGPARYIRYAASGVPLPRETVAYAARLGGAAAPAMAAIPQVRWQEARLFLDRESKPSDTGDKPMLQGGSAQLTSATSSGSRPAKSDLRLIPTLFPLSSDAAPVRR